MSITVQEKFGSRTTTEGDNPSIELLFLVSGTSDDIAAKLQLDADWPYMYDGLVKQSLHLEPDGNYRWIGTVRYGLYQRPATNDNSYQFECVPHRRCVHARSAALCSVHEQISTAHGAAESWKSIVCGDSPPPITNGPKRITNRSDSSRPPTGSAWPT